MAHKSYPRTLRLESLFLKEIAQWLHEEWDHPLREEVTVTRVEVTRDQQFAEVWVILHRDEQELVEKLLLDLARIVPPLTSHLLHSLRLKKIPRIRFQYDFPFARGSVVESFIFQEMQKRKEGKDLEG